MRVWICFRVAIFVWSPYRIETRVIPIALLDENVERPFSTNDYREARGAIADNSSAEEILEDAPRAPY
jgi:hypothetical protein